MPEDAVLLRGNIPTFVDGLTLTAGDVEEDAAVLRISDGTASSTVLAAQVGETVEAVSMSFTLVATRVGGNDREDLPDDQAWVVIDGDCAADRRRRARGRPDDDRSPAAERVQGTAGAATMSARTIADVQRI